LSRCLYWLGLFPGANVCRCRHAVNGAGLADGRQAFGPGQQTAGLGLSGLGIVGTPRGKPVADSGHLAALAGAGPGWSTGGFAAAGLAFDAGNVAGVYLLPVLRSNVAEHPQGRYSRRARRAMLWAAVLFMGLQLLAGFALDHYGMALRFPSAAHLI